jgi:formate dehydrogenase major subunit
MPAASHIEKDGHFTNTQRLLQFHDKALEPPGDARSELWFMHHLFKRVRAHYAGSEAERDWPIVNLKWDYPSTARSAEPDAEAVLKEINGYDVATGEPGARLPVAEGRRQHRVRLLDLLGCFKDGVNQTRRRDPGEHRRPEGGWVSPEWAWAWPANRRILYNRASADPRASRGRSARSTSGGTRSREVVGLRRPRLPRRQAARLPPGRRREGDGRDRRRRPVHHDGRRQGLAVRARGPARRPFPAHYEPYESPFQNFVYPEIGRNPAALSWNRPDNPGGR